MKSGPFRKFRDLRGNSDGIPLSMYKDQHPKVFKIRSNEDIFLHYWSNMKNSHSKLFGERIVIYHLHDQHFGFLKILDSGDLSSNSGFEWDDLQ